MIPDIKKVKLYMTVYLHYIEFEKVFVVTLVENLDTFRGRFFGIPLELDPFFNDAFFGLGFTI